MYTSDDICDIAVQIERNGERTYRLAGEKAKDPELSRTLFWMADEEERHARWFEALQTDRRESSDQGEMEAMGRSLLQDMVADQPFSLSGRQLRNAENVADVLTQFLKFEQDTIIFYDMLKAIIEDEQTTAQLERIIDEEREHVRIIEKLRKTLP